MQAILKHELIPMPLPLAEAMSHSMRTGNKSSVAEFLTEKAKVPGVNHTSKKMLLCSSMAYFCWKTRKSKHLEAFRATRGLCVKERIVVVFDRYRKQSIKATKRGRRSKNVAQIVGRV